MLNSRESQSITSRPYNKRIIFFRDRLLAVDFRGPQTIRWHASHKKKKKKKTKYVAVLRAWVFHATLKTTTCFSLFSFFFVFFLSKTPNQKKKECRTLLCLLQLYFRNLRSEALMLRSRRFRTRILLAESRGEEILMARHSLLFLLCIAKLKSLLLSDSEAGEATSL